MSRVTPIYVSHSWSTSDAYDKLLKVLRSDAEVTHRLLGIAKDDPIHTRGTEYELRAEIRRQMMPAQLLLVQASQYARTARWVDEEIDVARSGFTHRKRVLVIVPFASEEQSRLLQDRADRVVPWIGAEIVKAVRELCELPQEVVVSHLDAGRQTSPEKTVSGATLAGRKPVTASRPVSSAELRRSVFGMRQSATAGGA